MLAYLTAVYFGHRTDSSASNFFTNSNLVSIKKFAESLAIIVTEHPVKSHILNFLIMNSLGFLGLDADYFGHKQSVPL